MTGFGSASSSSHGFSVGWQLKSVNHRFLDLAFRLPDGYGEMEILAVKRLKSIFNRGRIECTLTIKSQPGQVAELKLNSALLQSVISLEEKVVAEASGDRSPLTMAALLSWSGMVSEQARPQMYDSDGEKPFSKMVLELLAEAAGCLEEMRRGEGRELGSVISGLLAELSLLVDRVEKSLPRVKVALVKRLEERLSELSASDIDAERLAQEQVYFINRLDVSEELDRLKIHLNEISAVLGYDEPIGRRLDFLCQELNREANTLCSKAQDGEITKIGIDMKVLVEKLREQVQNLE
jgi:uncharacterized protein (TIGR00255 family)